MVQRQAEGRRDLKATPARSGAEPWLEGDVLKTGTAPHSPRTVSPGPAVSSAQVVRKEVRRGRRALVSDRWTDCSSIQPRSNRRYGAVRIHAEGLRVAHKRAKGKRRRERTADSRPPPRLARICRSDRLSFSRSIRYGWRKCRCCPPELWLWASPVERFPAAHRLREENER